MYHVETSQTLKCTIKSTSLIIVFICVHHNYDHHGIKWCMRGSLMVTPIQRTNFRSVTTIAFKYLSCSYLFVGYRLLWKSDENYFQKKIIYTYINKILLIVSRKWYNKWSPVINSLMTMFMLRTSQKEKKKKTSWMYIFVWLIGKSVLKKKMNVDDPRKTMKGKESDPSIWPKGFI